VVAVERLALPAAGEKRLGNEKLPKLRNSLKKRGESPPSGARGIGHTHLTPTFLMDNEYQLCEGTKLT
jgi:hypothetical protein